MRFHESEEQSQIGQAAGEARLATDRQNGSVERPQYRGDPENAMLMHVMKLDIFNKNHKHFMKIALFFIKVDF
jgi:hypothetical protein